MAAFSKEDLRKTLKPIIRECVKESLKEMLVEGGFLSGLIKEVAGGLMSAAPAREQLVEQREEPTQRPNVYQQVQMRARNASLGEAKERLSKKLGKNVFAGIAEDDRIVNASQESLREGKINIPSRGSIPSSAEGMADPLRDMDPNDPGIPLEGIAELAGGMGKWASLL